MGVSCCIEGINKLVIDRPSFWADPKTLHFRTCRKVSNFNLLTLFRCHRSTGHLGVIFVRELALFNTISTRKGSHFFGSRQLKVAEMGRRSGAKKMKPHGSTVVENRPFKKTHGRADGNQNKVSLIADYLRYGFANNVYNEIPA